MLNAFLAFLSFQEHSGEQLSWATRRDFEDFVLYVDEHVDKSDVSWKGIEFFRHITVPLQGLVSLWEPLCTRLVDAGLVWRPWNTSDVPPVALTFLATCGGVRIVPAQTVSGTQSASAAVTAAAATIRLPICMSVFTRWKAVIETCTPVDTPLPKLFWEQTLRAAWRTTAASDDDYMPMLRDPVALITHLAEEFAAAPSPFSHKDLEAHCGALLNAAADIVTALTGTLPEQGCLIKQVATPVPLGHAGPLGLEVVAGEPFTELRILLGAGRESFANRLRTALLVPQPRSFTIEPVAGESTNRG